MPSPGQFSPEAKRRLRLFARFMDDSVPIPGTRYRIGFDPLVGLVPGLGDLLTLLASVYPLIEARRAGVGSELLLKMAGNVAIDALVGAVPILGDIFDAGFKAHMRNLRLLGIDPYPPEPPESEHA